MKIPAETLALKCGAEKQRVTLGAIAQLEALYERQQGYIMTPRYIQLTADRMKVMETLFQVESQHWSNPWSCNVMIEVQELRFVQVFFPHFASNTSYVGPFEVYTYGEVSKRDCERAILELCTHIKATMPRHFYVPHRDVDLKFFVAVGIAVVGIIAFCLTAFGYPF